MGGQHDPIRVGLQLGLTPDEASEVFDAFTAAAGRDEIPALWALPSLKERCTAGSTERTGDRAPSGVRDSSPSPECAGRPTLTRH